MRTRRLNLNQHHTITERPAPRRPHTRESQVSRPLVKGGQGRPAVAVRWSAEVALVCAMTAGLIGLVVALGHLGDAFR